MFLEGEKQLQVHSLQLKSEFSIGVRIFETFE